MTILASISSMSSFKLGGSRGSINRSSSSAGYGSNGSASVVNPLLPIAAGISGTLTGVTGLVAGTVTGAVDGFGKGLLAGILLGYVPSVDIRL